jgi:hypothetical protein
MVDLPAPVFPTMAIRPALARDHFQNQSDVRQKVKQGS